MWSRSIDSRTGRRYARKPAVQSFAFKPSMRRANTLRPIADDFALEAEEARSSAGHVTRADHDVEFVQAGQQAWDVARMMRKIGVHRDDRVESKCKRFSHAGDVRRSETQFGRPMNGEDARFAGGDGVDQSAGAVGGIVVHDDHVRRSAARGFRRPVWGCCRFRCRWE